MATRPEMEVWWGATSSESVLALALQGTGVAGLCDLCQFYFWLYSHLGLIASHPGHANGLIKFLTSCQTLCLGRL